jgi:hypothetical protein
MTDKVSSDMKELKNIMDEMKKTKLHLKKLKIQREELEEKISEYIKHENLPGLRQGTIAVYVKPKQKTVPKKKMDKIQDAKNVLEKQGIKNAEILLAEIMDSLKGESVMKDTVQIKQFRDYLLQ